VGWWCALPSLWPQAKWKLLKSKWVTLDQRPWKEGSRHIFCSSNTFCPIMTNPSFWIEHHLNATNTTKSLLNGKTRSSVSLFIYVVRGFDLIAWSVCSCFNRAANFKAILISLQHFSSQYCWIFRHKINDYFSHLHNAHVTISLFLTANTITNGFNFNF